MPSNICKLCYPQCTWAWDFRPGTWLRSRKLLPPLYSKGVRISDPDPVWLASKRARSCKRISRIPSPPIPWLPTTFPQACRRSAWITGVRLGGILKSRRMMMMMIKRLIKGSPWPGDTCARFSCRLRPPRVADHLRPRELLPPFFMFCKQIAFEVWRNFRKKKSKRSLRTNSKRTIE